MMASSHSWWISRSGKSGRTMGSCGPLSEEFALRKKPLTSARSVTFRSMPCSTYLTGYAMMFWGHTMGASRRASAKPMPPDFRIDSSAARWSAKSWISCTIPTGGQPFESRPIAVTASKIRPSCKMPMRPWLNRTSLISPPRVSESHLAQHSSANAIARNDSRTLGVRPLVLDVVFDQSQCSIEKMHKFSVGRRNKQRADKSEVNGEKAAHRAGAAERQRQHSAQRRQAQNPQEYVVQIGSTVGSWRRITLVFEPQQPCASDNHRDAPHTAENDRSAC